jgi:hypothetical protein
MKPILTFLLLSFVISHSSFSAETPNLLIILSDDMGYADIDVTGVQDIRTPTLERLAAQGTFLTDAYVTGPHRRARSQRVENAHGMNPIS